MLVVALFGKSERPFSVIPCWFYKSNEYCGKKILSNADGYLAVQTLLPDIEQAVLKLKVEGEDVTIDALRVETDVKEVAMDKKWFTPTTPGVLLVLGTGEKRLTVSTGERKATYVIYEDASVIPVSPIFSYRIEGDAKVWFLF